MLTYGSVVAGDADPVSDIDLVAVFDDVDYNSRWRLRLRLMRIAGDACGHYVTSGSPTWLSGRRKQDGVVVRGDPRRPGWSWRRANETTAPWSGTSPRPCPTPTSKPPTTTSNRHKTPQRRQPPQPRRRYRSPGLLRPVRGAAAVIVEALRALGAATQTDARALHRRDIATVVAHLPDEDQTAVRAHFGDRVTFDEVTMWRAQPPSAATNHRYWRMMPDDKKNATAESAEALAVAAIGVVEYVCDKIARLHGQREINHRVTRHLRVLRRRD